MGKKFAELIATTGRIGYLPFAPGTWASALSAILWYFICSAVQQPYWWQLALMPVIILTGIYCTNLILHDDEKDPSHIVIDEFAGLWLSLLIIPVTILNAILGFIFFRFFDIAKPFGIRKMERLKKGKGIMADDLLAGLYSNILLQLILFLKVC